MVDDVWSHRYLYEVVGGNNRLVVNGEERASTCTVRKLRDSDGNNGAGDHGAGAFSIRDMVDSTKTELAVSAGVGRPIIDELEAA